MKKKRQRTVWLARFSYQGDTYIRVGRVHNTNGSVPADIIRWQVVSQHQDGSHDFACTVDEAIAFISGLSTAVAIEALPQSGKLRKMFR